VLEVDQQTYNFAVDAGDQEKIKFTLFNADGTPFVGGSGTIAFIAKRSLDDTLGEAVISITSNIQTNQWDLTNWDTGIAILELLPANTSALAGERLQYVARVLDSSSKPHTPRRGLMTIRKNPGI